MRPIVPLLFLALVPGCGAFSALSEASAELDAYTLSPATAAEPAAAAAGRRHLVVELPTAPGALATDRILVKPLPFQAQYLPDGRWSEPAPQLVQALLVASFQNLGGFRLVERTGAGLMPDYTLMTDLQEFQAEPAGNGQLAVKIAVVLTLIRESDRRIVAARRFAATGLVASDATLPVVAGFDAALRTVLADAVRWVVATAR